MQDKQLVIYTAISGGYDRLREPEAVSETCDYVCFSDRNLRSRRWSIRRFDEAFDDSTFAAKKPKVLPHRYFADYDYSIWVDGNILVKRDLRPLVDEYLIDVDVALFEHPTGRRSIAREAEKCIELNKELPSRLREQVQRYYELGYPDPNHSLPTCFVIFRRHNAESIRLAMEEWWSHILCYSKRDQVSFPFVMWKNHVGFELINYDQVFSQYFRRIPHRRRGVQGLANRLLLRRISPALRSMFMKGEGRS